MCKKKRKTLLSYKIVSNDELLKGSYQPSSYHHIKMNNLLILITIIYNLLRDTEKTGQTRIIMYVSSQQHILSRFLYWFLNNFPLIWFHLVILAWMVSQRLWLEIDIMLIIINWLNDLTFHLNMRHLCSADSWLYNV